MATHKIELTPAPNGKALMIHDGVEIGISHQPLFAAARHLLSSGAAMPDDRIETWRDGMLCMFGVVEAAAGLTVNEPNRGALRIGKWSPFDREQIKDQEA